METPKSKYRIVHTIENAIDGGISCGFLSFLYNFSSILKNKDIENPKIKGVNTNRILKRYEDASIILNILFLQ